MNRWLGDSYELFMNVFGRSTPAATYILIALCVLLGALALSRVSTVLGAIGAFYTTALLLIPPGLLLLFAAMAAPQFSGTDSCRLPLLAAAAMLLIVIVPLTVLFQKGGYVTALIGWTVTLLTIGAVLSVEPLVMRSVDKYTAKALQIEKYRISTESYK